MSIPFMATKYPTEKWMRLFEGEQTVDGVIAHVLAEFAAHGSSPNDVNHGQCEEFANELESAAPNLFQSISIGQLFLYGDEIDPSGFDQELLKTHWPTYKPFPGTTWEQMFCNGVDWPGTHVWAYSPVTGLCYDAETPEGVSNPFDLSFFDPWKEHVANEMAQK